MSHLCGSHQPPFADLLRFDTVPQPSPKKTKYKGMDESRRQKKERSYQQQTFVHHIANNIFREFWRSLPVSPFNRQALVPLLSSLLGRG